LYAKFDCHPRAAVVIEPVSADSLRKTGISADRAGDFRRFPPQDRPIGSPETKSNTRKARISGPIARRLRSLEDRGNGWLGREGSNLRMAESKPAEYTNKINDLSELSSSVHPLKALANFLRSECYPVPASRDAGTCRLEKWEDFLCFGVKPVIGAPPGFEQAFFS
jgi:hypothetical protein